MSERGESLDPVRTLNVASWRKLRASRGRVQRALESQNLRPPNGRRHAQEEFSWLILCALVLWLRTSRE
jgi:hypothetical protein